MEIELYEVRKLINSVIDFAKIIERNGINYLITVGKSPQFLRYCLESFQDDDLDFFKDFLLGFDLENFLMAKELIKKLVLIPLSFSGVPQPIYEENLESKYCQLDTSNAHFDKETNSYTEEGLKKFLSFLKSKVDKIPNSSKIAVCDAVGRGGGLGMFIHLLKKVIDPKLYTKLHVMILNTIYNGEENFFHIENNKISFLVNKINSSFEETNKFNLNIFPFPYPFDSFAVSHFSDIKSLNPCDWEELDNQIINTSLDHKGKDYIKFLIPFVFSVDYGNNKNSEQYKIYQEYKNEFNNLINIINNKISYYSFIDIKISNVHKILSQEGYEFWKLHLSFLEKKFLGISDFLKDSQANINFLVNFKEKLKIDSYKKLYQLHISMIKAQDLIRQNDLEYNGYGVPDHHLGDDEKQTEDTELEYDINYQESITFGYQSYYGGNFISQ